jgi:serine/threonine protein kinase
VLKEPLQDLACRNILVGTKQTCKLNASISNVPICKLSDFGLCRAVEANSDFYAMKSGGVFPVRWTAPECVESQHSTRAGDVWSFAIVMWEVFTFGERPYWSWANTCVYKAVGDGYRLPPPTNCPTNVYKEVMGDCWHGNPDQRLDFDQIASKLTYFITSQHSTDDPLDSSNFNPFNCEAKEMVLRSGNSVEVWLQNLKLPQHWPKFQERNLTQLSQLTDTSYSDLRDSFGIELVGHRRKLIQSMEVIRQLKSGASNQLSSGSSRASRASVTAIPNNSAFVGSPVNPTNAAAPRSSWCSNLLPTAAANETIA